MILISTTGEGARLAVQRVENETVSVFVVAERPDGRRTQCVADCLTLAEAEELGSWLERVAAGQVSPTAEAGPQLAFEAPEIALSLVADDGYEATLRLFLSGAAGPAWVEEGERGRYVHHLPLVCRRDDLEVAAGHWRRELAKRQHPTPTQR